MGFDPLRQHGTAPLRKHFTPTLSQSIAPLNAPNHEGSGGVFVRLSSDPTDKRIGLLTCAHVCRPPPVFENTVYTREGDGAPREDVVLLGGGAFEDAVYNIKRFVAGQLMDISSSERTLDVLPAPEENEGKKLAIRRKELLRSIGLANAWIKQASELYAYVTTKFATAESRVFGFVLHSAKMEVDAADKFMRDWCIVQVDNDKIDGAHFQGNKLYVGRSLSFSLLSFCD